MAKCLAPSSVGVVDIATLPPTALARCGAPRPATWGAVQAQAQRPIKAARAGERLEQRLAGRSVSVAPLRAGRARLGSATAAAALLRKRRSCGLSVRSAHAVRTCTEAGPGTRVWWVQRSPEARRLKRQAGGEKVLGGE